MPRLGYCVELHLLYYPTFSKVPLQKNNREFLLVQFWI